MHGLTGGRWGWLTPRRDGTCTQRETDGTEPIRRTGYTEPVPYFTTPSRASGIWSNYFFAGFTIVRFGLVFAKIQRRQRGLESAEYFPSDYDVIVSVTAISSAPPSPEAPSAISRYRY